jgi:transposase
MFSSKAFYDEELSMYRNLEQWSMIRRRVLNENVSQRQVARETGILRSTIHKILQHKCPQPRRPRARYSKLGPYTDIIDQLVTANVSLPPHARLSIKAIYNHLQQEAGFTGSYRSVQDYVRKAAVSYYNPYCGVWGDAYELIVSLSKSEAIAFMLMLSCAKPPAISSTRAQKFSAQAAKLIKPCGDVNSRQKKLDTDFKWMRRVLQKEISLRSTDTRFDSHPDFSTIFRRLYAGCLTHRNRAMVVLAHGHGISDRSISAFLKIHRKTVRRAREIFNQGGAGVLFAPTTRSNRKVNDCDLATAIFSVLHEPPSNHGINRTSWTMAHLCQVLGKIGKPTCPEVVRTITKAAGYKWRKARVVLTSNDPDYSEKLARIRSVLSGLKPDEALFSIDEFGPFAVKAKPGRLNCQANRSRISIA